jgi:hypothetical protein
MRSQYTDQLMERAQRDDDFRARLLSDPKAAIGEELGVEIPEPLNISVIEEGADQVIAVLPAETAPGALREEELARAAGRSGMSWCEGHAVSDGLRRGGGVPRGRPADVLAVGSRAD